MDNASFQVESLSQLLAELLRQGITDERVLAALNDVPRDRFVPDSERDRAWANQALPIGAGQTISQPYIVGLMTQALSLQGDERVLEVGTGSGYQAAVLARLARQVYSIERIPELATSAVDLLRSLGIENVAVHVGDGTRGWPELAPYDAILVAAGAPRVPQALVDQLSPEGGRLVIPLGDLDDQRLFLYERQADRLVETDLGPVRFVPLVGEGAWRPDSGAKS